MNIFTKLASSSYLPELTKFAPQPHLYINFLDKDAENSKVQTDLFFSQSKCKKVKQLTVITNCIFFKRTKLMKDSKIENCINKCKQ